jgi:hypothetical protein
MGYLIYKKLQLYAKQHASFALDLLIPKTGRISL